MIDHACAFTGFVLYFQVEMYSFNSKSHKNKKGLKITLITLAVLVAMGLTFVHLEKSGRINLISDKPKSMQDDGINYSPPTEEEQRVGDETKDKIANSGNHANSQAPDEQPADKKSVSPVISTWQQDGDGNIRINGFVQGVIEDNGSCEYTLTKDDKRVVQSRSSMINAQDTTCGQIIIDKTELSAGKWQTTLHYTSPTSEGTSDETIIEVK